MSTGSGPPEPEDRWALWGDQAEWDRRVPDWGDPAEPAPPAPAEPETDWDAVMPVRDVYVPPGQVTRRRSRPVPGRTAVRRLPPGAVGPPSPAERRTGIQLLRPSSYGLILILFALPFLTVSCTTPTGFGRVQPARTTAYSGFDLAFGAAPHRGPLLPADQWRSDHLPWQPLFVFALVVLVAGLVLPLLIRRISDRQRVSVGVAGLALLTVVVAAAVAKNQLTDLVRLDAASRNVQLAQPASFYVTNGQGLVLAVVLLLAIVVIESLGLRNHRRARAVPARPDLGAPAMPTDAPPKRQIGGPWQTAATTSAESPRTPPDPAG